MKGEITGIGGIFLKVKDPEATKKWYLDNLGIDMGAYGGIFNPQSPKNGKGYWNFSFFSENSDYFSPSQHEYMLNFRVIHIEDFIEQLQKKGVEILDELEVYEYGKFIHILDCNGLKIELWEAIDSAEDFLPENINPKD